MKVLAWLARLTMAAVLISACSMYTTWMTVQSYLDHVLAQYGVKKPAQKAQFSEFLAQMTTNLNIMKQSVADKVGESSAGKEADKPENGGYGTGKQGEDRSTTGTAGGSKAEREGGGEASPVPGGDALPVWNQSGQLNRTEAKSQVSASNGNENETDRREQLLLTTEQLQRTKDKLSDDDKMKIFTLLVSKLPQKELQDISLLVEDGITGEELKQMEGIVEKHLTPPEYKQLLTILEKY